MGKTYLTHVLEQELDSALRPFVRLVFPQLSPSDMLGYLAMRLGAVPGPGVHRASQDQILCSLEARLESLAAEGGVRLSSSMMPICFSRSTSRPCNC